MPQFIDSIEYTDTKKNKVALDGVTSVSTVDASTLSVANAVNATSATKAGALEQTDDRAENEPPSHYHEEAQLGKNFIVEFKESAKIGLSGQPQYCQLITYAKWTDETGGNLTQVAVVDANYFIRTSIDSDSWGAWQRLLKEGEVETVVKSASEWSSQNPVLSAGRFGYDTTDKITKIGDGTTAWNALPLFVTTDLSFANLSWANIAAFSEGGTARKYFSVGDEKTIELTTGEKVTLVILGFNHDNLTSGGTAGITIGMKNLLAMTYRMNAGDTNAGGWDESEMRTSTMATLFSQLPSDLQSVIKQVNKKAMVGRTNTSIKTSADKLWLLAQVEVNGETKEGYAEEGEQYEYWKTVKDGTVAGNRIKHLSNGSGSENSWWLRSPYTVYVTTFCSVSSAGDIIGKVADAKGGVSFGFCV